MGEPPCVVSFLPSPPRLSHSASRPRPLPISVSARSTRPSPRRSWPLITGAASTSADISATPSAAKTCVTSASDPEGFLGGAQIGFNWQTGAFVFGIEGDWSWTNADGSAAIPGAIVNVEHNWYGTATARVGYAVDNWLWYVKGGAAWMDADYSIGGVSSGDTRTGWTVGTGLEWALGPNWSAKLEYNYLDFGNERIAAPIGVDADTQAHLVKLGLNYRFDWGKGPVTARY